MWGWYNIGFLGFGFGFYFGLGYLCVFGFSAVGCALEVGLWFGFGGGFACGVWVWDLVGLIWLWCMEVCFGLDLVWVRWFVNLLVWGG